MKGFGPLPIPKSSIIAIAVLGFLCRAAGGEAGGAPTPDSEYEALIKAAEAGDAISQTELAADYALGRGVERNAAEALKWYQKAADQGEGAAQLALGEMYSAGLDVRQDYVLAYMWFDLASGLSWTGRSTALKQREKTASSMTPRQIAAAQKLVQEWKSAHGRSPKAKRKPKQETAIDGVTAPVPLSQPLPALTDEARKAGVKGEVILQCTVRVNGTVDSCKVLTKLGYGLDESAIRTITNLWRFKPATLEGKPGDAKIMISISANQFR